MTELEERLLDLEERVTKLEENSDVDGNEVEYIRVDIHEALIEKLECTISHLEEMRPFWAKGYSSDSMAAQTATGALSNIWRCLGVKDQTACMYALEELKKHKENGAMTKLQELKAARDVARDNAKAAWAAVDDYDDAWADLDAQYACDAARAASAAYDDELKRTQEEKQNE